MMIVWGAVMVLALIGMIVCSKKQKTNPAMQPVAFVLFVVVVVGGIMLLRETGTFGGGQSSLMKSELAFYASQGNKVGQYFAQSNGGKKILLLVEDTADESAKLLADALKAGYKGEVVMDTVIPPPTIGSDNPIPPFLQMKASDFDAAFEKHADAGIVVSLIGLPQDAAKMKFWKAAADKRPAFLLIGLPSGQMTGLAVLVASGNLTGIVIPKPNAKYDITAPSDPNAAFDIRYVLVDKSNIEQYKSQLM